MNRHLTIILILLTACSKNSKWEEIRGNGISDEPMSIDEAIYFESINNGLIGGYKLIEDKKSDNVDHLEQIPVLYFTKNSGQEWILLEFENDIKGGVNNLYLSRDTIFCRVDSVILKSENLGTTWTKLNLVESRKIKEKLFNKNRYAIKNYDFEFQNKKYRVKEKYSFEKTIVIVCNGQESLTDYYFVSNDHGLNWNFAQEDVGSNKQKFLYKNEYLLTFESPYGLQRLKLN